MQGSQNRNGQYHPTKSNTKEESSFQKQNRKYALKGLISFFSDCYWSKEDSYASYFWSKLDIEQKEELLSIQGDLGQYFVYLGQVRPGENLYFFNEDFYLNDGHFNNVSNEDLKQILVETPSLYNQLSELRKNHIEIDFEIKLKALKEKKTLFDVSRLPESSPRELKFKSIITPRNIEEEIVLLNQDYTLADKECILSLVWAKDLDHHDMREILQQYSAQDLTQVWTAPEEILNIFMEALPEKKYELMTKIMGTDIVQDRKSNLYQKLHRDIIEKLRLLSVHSLTIIHKSSL